ncbi:hypothetical protein [Microlunatus flavus]|uniref:Uncharacterized protein n=1 Tax=Microlunatus flavus TaxID=1036181 RepID=A0A1H9J0Z8_9ACTN|nr:hypothetical protein [Microlunatus flavus]SEQ80439.1 hypothetical protein SAMN05421756_10654 [Microlunatus flavus]
MKRLLPVALAGLLLASGPWYGAEARVGSCASNTTDVDGGGPDVVLGLPSYDLAGKPDAGALVVFSDVAAPGSDDPRNPVRRTLLTMDDIPGLTAQAGARFGAAVLLAPDYILGDDGDYCSELVVGAPGQTVDGRQGAGQVFRLRGSTSGAIRLSATWDEASLSGLGGAQAGAAFGSSLAGVNGGNVVVGAPGRDVDGVVDAGWVVSASLDGSRVAGRTTQTGSGDGAAEAGDRFGEVLRILPTCVGSFLVVGVPHEDVGPRSDAGAVVLVGPAGTQSLTHQSTPGAGDAAEVGDRYGAALDAYFTGTGSTRRGLVAIGVPGEDVGTAADAGTVSFASFPAPPQAVFSGLVGLPATLDQASPGVAGSVAAGDAYGTAVATGGFGPGPSLDLVTSSPREDVGTVGDAGLADTISLRDDGSADPGRPGAPWTQDSPGVPDRAEAGDLFGSDVAAVGLPQATDANLVVVTVPGEDVASVPDAGVAHLGAPPGDRSVLLVMPVYQVGAGLGMTVARVMPDSVFCGA